MAMSKQHFIEVARAVKDNKRPDASGCIRGQGLVNDLCRFFKGQNPRFDENRFREACGFEVE